MSEELPGPEAEPRKQKSGGSRDQARHAAHAAVQAVESAEKQPPKRWRFDTSIKSHPAVQAELKEREAIMEARLAAFAKAKQEAIPALPGSGSHDEQGDGKDDDADQDDEELDKKMRDKAWVCTECSQVAG